MKAKERSVALEFFRARLREDEAAARAMKIGKDDAAAKVQARALADVAAKWEIIRLQEHCDQLVTTKGFALGKFVAGGVTGVGLDYAIGYLVAAYRDHPDWRPEWEPVKPQPEAEYEPDEYRLSTRA
ncbi:DUF6221 family protein [Streptomyces sp. CO7]